MPFFALSPGVYPTELDLSLQVAPLSTSTAAAVFSSKQGPMELTFVSSRTQFLALYGVPDVSVSFGHHTCLAFLLQGQNLWVQRVANGALYAGATYIGDSEGEIKNITFKSFDEGFEHNYLEGAQEIQNLQFGSTPFVTGNVFNLTIEMAGQDDLGNVINGQQDITVAFNTNNTQTLLDITSAIQGGMDVISPSGTAEFLPATATSLNTIRITAPRGALMALLNIGTTGGVSQPEWSIADVKMFDVFAQNPGTWADKVATQITNYDMGTPERLKLTFSKRFQQGYSFSCKVNGTPVGPVPYFASNNATLDNIAATLQAALGLGAQASVIQIGGGPSNNREIVLVAPDAKSDIQVTDAIVSGGTLPPIVVVRELITRVAPSNTFTFNVYTTDDLVNAKESFTVSMADQVDGFGNQQNIAEVINAGPKKSAYIRIYQPDSSKSMEVEQIDPIPRILTGGDDGAAVTASDINNGWNSFQYRDEVDVRILMNCGYSVPAVQQYMTNIAQNRMDCIAVLDCPSNSQLPQDYFNYRVNTLNLDSSYAALYGPDLQILDSYTNKTLFIPPSGYVAAVYAKTDRVAATWFAPAGLTRADLSSQILGLRYNYNLGDQGLLYPAQCNFIIKKPGQGYPIWSAVTLQSAASALSNINVRRLLIVLENSIATALDYNVFDPNDPKTRFLIQQKCENFLAPIKAAEGLYDFDVVCDARNNSDADVDAGVLNVDVYVKPVIPAVFIRLTTIVTKSGASFSEIEQSRAGI